MKSEDIKVGKWYMIENYGYSRGIKGNVKSVDENYITMSFYWGSMFRSRQIVESNRLICETKRPSFFSNY